MAWFFALSFVAGAQAAASTSHALDPLECNRSLSGWLVEKNDGMSLVPEALCLIMAKRCINNFCTAVADHAARDTFLNATPYGPTPLVLASLHFDNEGYMEIVRLLLEYGADPNVHAPGYFPPCLIKLCHLPDYVRLLLEHRAAVDIRDDATGDTALIRAAGNGWADTVAILLKNRPDLTIHAKDGDTALIRAARKGYAHVVRMLIAHGGLTPCEREQLTALESAQQGAHHVALIQAIDEGLELKWMAEMDAAVAVARVASNSSGRKLIDDGPTLKRLSKTGAAIAVGSTDLADRVSGKLKTD